MYGNCIFKNVFSNALHNFSLHSYYFILSLRVQASISVCYIIWQILVHVKLIISVKQY